MARNASPRLPNKIYAEASVRSLGGTSLFEAGLSITKENVTQFYSDPQLQARAAAQLEAAGFDVLDRGRVSLTIAASPETYEQAFRTRIFAEERSVIKGGGNLTTATFIDSDDTKTSGLINVSQSALAEVLEGVAINEPIYYFDSGFPLATPPNQHHRYWYLDVPGDLVRGLNAAEVHRQHVTGRGVSVVMVDTGWYEHPFFQKQGYCAEVILGPGAEDKISDLYGHGTGESANLFAIAPEAKVTMVKADLNIQGRSVNANTIAAFRRAMALRPDIISCSWGLSRPDPKFSATDRVLEATVADAARQGIIVIFSAGNGQWGFPAQHPNVIAAGGVYQPADGSLEASDYASGFASRLYRNRIVPDVCGLVGKQPRGNYLMLPVPLGSLIDRSRGATTLRYPEGDETGPNDGWAAFSGTSAAAPQLAGICALLKQLDAGLTTNQARALLVNTARDVERGRCNDRTGGHAARRGIDLATGSGLADASAAVALLRKRIAGGITPASGMQPQPFGATANDQIFNRKETKIVMDPRLTENWDEILWGLNHALTNQGGLQYSRSPGTKAAEALRTLLQECWKNAGGGVLTSAHIEEKHISAAKSLLKMGRHLDAAIEILTTALSGTYAEQAAEALGALPPERIEISRIENSTGMSLFDDCYHYDPVQKKFVRVPC